VYVLLDFVFGISAFDRMLQNARHSSFIRLKATDDWTERLFCHRQRTKALLLARERTLYAVTREST